MKITKKRKLTRYELDFNRALNHINYSLENANCLSDALLNTIDFKSGCFFTLLLDNSNLDRLHEFKDGIILPQNPEMKYLLAETTATYSIIPTMHDEIAYFLFKEVKKRDSFTYIFDDVLGSPSESYLQEKNEKRYVIIHEKEVYYQVKNEKATIDCLIKYIERSNTVWHSLCILTNFFLNSEEFTLGQIKEACLNTQLIMVGAYDGEGYVFWERYQDSV